MNRIIMYLNEFIATNYVTDIRLIDLAEILIIAIFLYRVMIWIQNTKAWMLLRGVLVIGIFILIAIMLNMQTILFIAKNSVNVLATAIIVVFQPEIRRALENLGQKNILYSLPPFEKNKTKSRISIETIDSIVESCTVMSKEKTGALIVIENNVKLTEFIATGIDMECQISSQILLNIFEHNTPLHDGAIILRKDRIAAATCYLPLSENLSLDKNLGTRHRAAIGITEVSDALVIVVSEESGNISIAHNGLLDTNINIEGFKEHLSVITNVKYVNVESPDVPEERGGDINETENIS